MAEGDEGDRTARRDWQDRFLAALRDRGSVKDAAEIAGIHRATAYKVRLEDEAFREAWQAITHDVVTLLEDSALQRALDGDARLTEFLLKANRPTKYRDTLKIDGKIAIASEAELDAEIEEFQRRRREEEDPGDDRPVDAGEGPAEGPGSVPRVGTGSPPAPAAAG